MKANRRRVFQDRRTYHVTHRYQNRDFKLGFACDRDNYRMPMWEISTSLLF